MGDDVPKKTAMKFTPESLLSAHGAPHHGGRCTICTGGAEGRQELLDALTEGRTKYGWGPNTMARFANAEGWKTTTGQWSSHLGHGARR